MHNIQHELMVTGLLTQDKQSLTFSQVHISQHTRVGFYDHTAFHSLAFWKVPFCLLFRMRPVFLSSLYKQISGPKYMKLTNFMSWKR